MVSPQEEAGGGGTAVDVLMAAADEGCIADADRLEAYSSLSAAERPPLDATLRGVLAETALHNRQRYPWRLLVPLLHTLVDSVLADYQPADEEAGPPRPPPPGFEGSESLAARLHSLLDSFDAAPFTLQRLCEVLLEPRKQYARLDKVAVAIEKLLMVTSTLPEPNASGLPPPRLAELQGVNDNPPSPYLDGRPPQVLDPQQHQALLQQQAQAMAAAQQQHMGQPGRLGGLPNGLEAVGGGEAGAAAAAAAEAMQLDVPPLTAAAPPQGPPPVSAAEAEAAASFIESALADEEAGPPAPGGSPPAPALSAAEAAAKAAAAGSVPSTPEQQHDQQGAAEPSPGMQQQQQQQQSQDGGAASAAQPAAEAAAQPASTEDVLMTSADDLLQQQTEAPVLAAPAEQPPGGGEAGQPRAEVAGSSGKAPQLALEQQRQQ